MNSGGHICSPYLCEAAETPQICDLSKVVRLLVKSWERAESEAECRLLPSASLVKYSTKWHVHLWLVNIKLQDHRITVCGNLKQWPCINPIRSPSFLSFKVFFFIYLHFAFYLSLISSFIPGCPACSIQQTISSLRSRGPQADFLWFRSQPLKRKVAAIPFVVRWIWLFKTSLLSKNLNRLYKSLIIVSVCRLK